MDDTQNSGVEPAVPESDNSIKKPERNLNTLGGWRPGSGRKPGSLNKKTLEQKVVYEELRQRVMHHADDLFAAQLALARGNTYVYRIDEKKEGKIVKREHVLVTDPDEIKELLDAHDGGDGVVNEHYYFITTRAPDNRAIDSMFDRTFGRAVQKNEVTGKDGEPLPTPIMAL